MEIGFRVRVSVRVRLICSYINRGVHRVRVGIRTKVLRLGLGCQPTSSVKSPLVKYMPTGCDDW